MAPFRHVTTLTVAERLFEVRLQMNRRKIGSCWNPIVPELIDHGIARNIVVKAHRQYKPGHSRVQVNTLVAIG